MSYKPVGIDENGLLPPRAMDAISGRIAGDAADPESEFGAQLSATIDEAIAASGAGAAGAVDVVTNGDSITAGGQTDTAEGRVIPFAELLSEYLGVAVYNPAVPGERMGDISVRQGGTLIEFTVPGGVIPAGTSTFAVARVSPAASEFVGGGTGNSRSLFDGTFLGVPVTVRYDGSSWTMARKTAATVAKPVPSSGGMFRIAKDRANRAAVHVFFGGRNGGSVTARTAEMVTFLGHDRFVVMDPLTGSADSGPSSSRAALAAAYPYQYYDMRGYMIANGLNDEGITPTAQDLTDIGNDTIPASLRVDSIHPNAAGQRVIARRLAEVMIERGLVEAGATFVPERVIPLPTFDGPTHVVLPTSDAYATINLPSIVESLDAFSIETLVQFDSVGVLQPIFRRNETDGSRVMHAYLLSSGLLRFQWFPTGVNPGTVIDTSVATDITAETLRGIRIDFDAAARMLRFYTSPSDFSTWTQVGTDRTGTASSLFDSTTPLRVGMFAGELHGFRVKSFDRATTYIDENFDYPLPSEWTLDGGAVLVES